MALDYKSFLNKRDTLVLPYLGGTRVDAKDRRLRVERQADDTRPIAHGWWHFQVDGRRAVPQELTPAPDLAALPAVRGHYVSGWIVVDGRQLHPLALMPDDEPAPLSRIAGRRWYSGDVLFDTTEFEDDAEVRARQALEERRPLGDVRGVVPSLRAAFGYAVGIEVARELDVHLTPREILSRVVEIAERGREVVMQMFHAVLEQRMREAEEARRRVEEALQAQRLATATRGARAIARHRTAERRADDALEKAGARMLSARRLAGGEQLDVTYTVDGTRIMSIVDADTLGVLDPGICLSGAHRVLTLDAMPSVVREAIEEESLNITRRS
jgi:hypothetical protein